MSATMFVAFHIVEALAKLENLENSFCSRARGFPCSTYTRSENTDEFESNQFSRAGLYPVIEIIQVTADDILKS